jgi:hypothetical protein
MTANLDQQPASQYQIFNNDDSNSYYTSNGLNDNEILMEDSMNRSSK